MFTSVKQNTIYPWHYVFEIFKERLNNYMGLPTKPSTNCKRKARLFIRELLHDFDPSFDFFKTSFDNDGDDGDIQSELWEA